MRRAIPVVGVAAWGWSGAAIACLFVLESWLFLTVRSAVEMTFDPLYAPEAPLRSPVQTAVALGGTLVLTGITFAMLVTAFGGFVAVLAFSDDQGARFVAEGWKERSFGFGVIGLVAEVIAESVLFTRRLGERTAAEREHDDVKVKVMLYRNVPLLFGATLIMALVSALQAGGLVVVVGISLTLLYFETFPKRAIRIVQ